MVKLKPVWKLCKLLLFLVLLLVLFAVVWLRQGPKSLNWAKPTILNHLNNPQNSYQVAVGDMAIDWRNISRLGLVRLKDVRLTGRDGATFAALPEIYVSLDIIGFLPNRRVLNSIYLPKPKLYLTRDKQKQLRLGLQGGDAPMAPLVTVKNEKPAAPWNGKLPFRKIAIDDFTVVISDEVSGKTLTSKHGVVQLNRRFGYYSGKLELPFTYDKKRGVLMAKLHSSDWETHELNATLKYVPSDYLCMLVACPGGLELSGIVEGNITLGLDGRFRPYGGEGTLSTDSLTVTAPEWFPEPLRMKQSSVALSASDDMQRITLNKLELDMEDVYLTATAKARKREDGWHVNAHAQADKLPVGKLYKYWPQTLASNSRQWVTDSLSVGMAENSSLDLKLTPQDFTSPTLSDQALDATVHAKGMTVHYIPDFPEVTGVDGVVKFTGKTITIDAAGGTLLAGTSLSNTRVRFTDLHAPGTPMEVETTLNAPASDAATFLKLEHFAFDDGLELNPAKIKGTVEGTVKLGFDAFSESTTQEVAAAAGEAVHFDDVAYAVDLQLKDISQPGFAGLFDLRAASAKLKADNKGMALDGTIPFSPKSALKVAISQQSGHDVTLGLEGTLERPDLLSLGLPDDQRFGEGSMKLKAEMTLLKEDVQLKSGMVDLTDMAFRIPEISWQKRRGAAGEIAVSPKDKAYMLTMKAPGLYAPNATLSLAPGGQLRSLILPRVKTENSDFSFSYTNGKNGMDVVLGGNTLDASMSYMGSGASGTENSLLADFPAIQLKLDLGALVLVPDRPLSQVKGTLYCNALRCESADISARAGDADVQATISRPAGQREFLLTATNAGDLLRALDMTDRMYGGTLRLHGTYDDSVVPPALAANLGIRKFTLRNSQILGRILSIGSLTGLSNALTGSGIAFDRLTAAMVSQGGVIRISDGKASGNALGMSLAGIVDTRSSTLNLRGTLVPAAALNTIFSKIPLLGRIAGGDDGLIAFNFSVSGPQADPGVMVNPFSGLTPGFLRGIWGSNEPSADEIPQVEVRPAPAEGKSSAQQERNAGRRHQRGVGF